ncbi:MAG: hypothetical protein A2V93_03985 [Ignavibacteria bacterium RBG_16_34_14]|nr:MAG: hypothetical protein A2V93_03985 [Ignavibacteria bacterium RBG_16_34_14]
MHEENYKIVTSLPERMDEIINQVQNDSSITGALLNDKFYNDFNSLLSDLNELISEEKEIPHKYAQISMF